MDDQPKPAVSRQIAPLEPQYLTPLALTIAEACQVARIGRSNLGVAIQSGALRARKLGIKTLILRSDLLAWLESLPFASSGDANTGATRTPTETAAAPPSKRRLVAAGAQSHHGRP
ncbi:excisionase family DNA binding protein [Bradyrhizobium sp. R2.2-H]|uniref:helix-turn-helix domain-containing protein n=1 Tax=unclassified Bradyrhizobium TaxID=2631580 RepID=UPI001052373C|nr:MULTISPECIES: helix-turn-helix domain-containing protein [unclassified Bradyrhizobium]TCU75305.1 excisionase family DNA binding protein [Bradyrhizobium sp. Y-H1]TCU78073.1 excisionase family DNA binding protein [Bradyrhizobium sp. R2.2-H]